MFSGCIMKKIISVLLSLIIIIGSVLCTGVNAFALSTAKGVDVSEHNGNVNFNKLKNEGNKFVMIRLGWIGNGANNIDKQFWENVKKANAAKMNFGIYFYSYAFDKAEAQEEADFVIDTLEQMIDKGYGEYFTLPVAYDLEDKLISNNCNKTQITSNMVTFCEAVKNAGYRPMVYANLNWFNNYIDINTVVSKGYLVWYAYWGISTNNYLTKQIEVGKTGVKADIWQYDDGSIKNDNIDRNIAYNLESLIQPIPCVHIYDNGTITRQPTCTVAGVKTYTCTVCGKKKTESVAKKAHTYKNYVTKATSRANGSIVNKCSVCGTKKSTTVPKVSSFKLSATNYTYDGKVKTPAVTIKDSKGKTLRKGTDYDVTYSSGRKNVGKYVVKIVLKGNYAGTKTLYFNINPKGTSIVKVTPKSKAFTVSWNKQTNQTTGYQIQYSVYSNFKSAKTITMPKNTYYAKSITGLSGNKRYYVRIRTYKTVKFNGKNYNLYSPWSSTKYTTTKK